RRISNRSWARAQGRMSIVRTRSLWVAGRNPAPFRGGIHPDMADFRWYGHNGFRIRSKEGTIITDPPGRSTGYAFSSKPSADIVTVSHDHAEHKNFKGIKDDFALIDGPG